MKKNIFTILLLLLIVSLQSVTAANIGAECHTCDETKLSDISTAFNELTSNKDELDPYPCNYCSMFS